MQSNSPSAPATAGVPGVTCWDGGGVGGLVAVVGEAAAVDAVVNPDCEELDVSGNRFKKPHSSSKTHVTKMSLRAGAGIHTVPARATVSCPHFYGAATVYVCTGPDGALVAKLAHCRLRSVAVSSWRVASVLGDCIVGNDRVLRCGGSLHVRSIVPYLARVVVSRVVAAALVPRVDPAHARFVAVAAAWDAAVWCARLADGAVASVARCASARDTGDAASPAVVLSRQQKKHVKRRDRRDQLVVMQRGRSRFLLRNGGTYAGPSWLRRSGPRRSPSRPRCLRKLTWMRHSGWWTSFTSGRTAASGRLLPQTKRAHTVSGRPTSRSGG